MKALRIHEFGAPAQAALEDLHPVPPGPGHIGIRVEAASVNPLDLHMLSGRMQAVFPIALPYTLGTDVAGVVDAVGPGVTGFKAGDRVVGRLEPTVGGAFAEAAVLPAGALCRMPAGMGFEQAAALPTAAGTAWRALFGPGALAPGHRVLVHAGAGGVGSFAVQFAKQAGAHVIATASSANHALVKELGADELVDYRREDFALRAGDVDLVIDTVGGATLERSWQAIKPGGRLVTLVDPTVRGRDGIQGSFLFFTHEAALLQDILRRFENRRLQVILDTIHPLDDARAALAQVAAGHARGKVIVRPPR